jgi:hypothetical protein
MSSSKPIRRSQLISPFGIGSMMDFPNDESLMPAGLDTWPSAKEGCPKDSGWLIREERLEARLKVTHFRMPPDYKEEGGDAIAYKHIPFIRFPRWHYCHRCGLMRFLSIFGSHEHCQGGEATEFEKKCKEQYEKTKTKKYIRSPRLIPSRFVAVCESGHIQDFPFMEWLHREKPFDFTSHKLKLRAGRSSAGLSGIVVECSCGIKRSLGNVFEFDKQTKRGPLSHDDLKCFCKGLRPWLGEMDGSVKCGTEHLRVLQRGATNVYFSQIVSSIYLPLWAENISTDVIAVLEQPHVWALLSQGTVNGQIDQARCQMIAQMRGVDPKELELAAQRKLEGNPPSGFTSATGDEEEFRRSEYQAICDGKVGSQSELFVECADLADYEPEVAKFFSRIRHVHKLRETRALVGFTRILPPDGNLSSNRLQTLKLDQQIDWLPAIKVYGEGIFLEVNSDELAKWEATVPGLRPEFRHLVAHYNAARAARLQPNRNITAKFMLLHTLAHALINQLSFDCGYGSASLRERLYCDFNDPSLPMQGILIYTASGDSEGTMGGLVRQGKPGRLEATLRRALQHAAWCSSDPVCIESKGQGSDNSNLAACHGCCLLPETSCEEGNRLLDRALLIGTPEHPSVGFFGELL